MLIAQYIQYSSVDILEIALQERNGGSTNTIKVHTLLLPSKHH